MFSLEPEGRRRRRHVRSTYDGSTHRFTPEIAVDIQQLLGADIQMVLDVCPPLPSTPEVVRRAVERTAAWAARARAGARRDDQALFGIVQGGVDEAMRAESAERTVDLGFDGYGIGGLSVGETRAEMLPALAAAIAHLPADRPRYLMGVGDPAQPRRGGRARRRPVRLRDADPARPPRHGADVDRQVHIKNADDPQRRPDRRRRAPARSARGTAAATSATCSRWASPPRCDWSACTTSAGRCS